MRILYVLLLGAALSTGVVADSKSDGQISDSVRRKLAGDPDVKCGACDVDVTDGMVTIKGTVENERCRGKAEKLAKKIKGVKGVNNQLRIKNAQ
jgi:hyperosmotically inducible periplasmic protein